MNVHGIGPGMSINAISRHHKTVSLEETQTASPSISDAATAEISEDAKSQSEQSGKAKPHEVAEALGAKNFGQALKLLREAGVELSNGFISDLVHGDEAALTKAQEALAPLAEESEQPTENHAITPDQPVESPPALDTSVLLETLLEEIAPQNTLL